MARASADHIAIALVIHVTTETDLLERTESPAPSPVGPTETAREAIVAVLETIADRVTGGQAGDLAISLLRDLRSPSTEADEAALSFDRADFFDRIASRVDVETDDATTVTRAVADAIRETGGERELQNGRTQLPNEFDRPR